jgi:hypothetical protein
MLVAVAVEVKLIQAAALELAVQVVGEQGRKAVMAHQELQILAAAAAVVVTHLLLFQAMVATAVQAL